MNSMTGFGVARGRMGRVQFVVEAKSLNHRFCEVNLRSPVRFSSLEPEITRLVRRKFSRGRFDLSLREEASAREEREVSLAREAYRLLRKIRRELPIEGEITLGDLIRFRGLLTHASLSGEDPVEASRQPLIRLISQALDALQRMRGREGKNIRRWLSRKVGRLMALLNFIEKDCCRRAADYRQKLQKKLRGLGELDETRIVQESALMAERDDVTEEIVRLRSHLKEFARFMGLRRPGKPGEPVGRKFDFLAQEMGREINTIGSKAGGVRLAHKVVEFKAELERVREQIQNIE